MKVLIAIDSFKGSLSSNELANRVESGIKKVYGDADIVKVPVADGGVGFPEDSFDGIIDEVRLTNTALDPSQFLFAESGPTALGVPEPAALGLAGLALAGALLARRRRPR